MSVIEPWLTVTVAVVFSHPTNTGWNPLPLWIWMSVQTADGVSVFALFSFRKKRIQTFLVVFPFFSFKMRWILMLKKGSLRNKWPLCFSRPPVFVCFAYLWTLRASQAGSQLGVRLALRSKMYEEPPAFLAAVRPPSLQRRTWPEVDLLMPLLYNYTSEIGWTTVRVEAQLMHWKAAAATYDSLPHHQINRRSMRHHLAGGLDCPSLA